MHKTITVAAIAVGLIGVGMGVAEAANSGYMSVSTDGSYVSNGYYNFYGRYDGGGKYDTEVRGNFVVTTASDHLNGKVDGYGYTQLARRTSNGTTPYDYYLTGTDIALVASSVNIQVCREHWYGDDCHSITKTR